MSKSGRVPLTPAEQELFERVRAGRLPRHVGIIMDGNGRWAQQHGYSRIRGHQAGARNVNSIVRLASDLGIAALTLYAFSLENWARPSFEVSALMRLIRTYVIRERNQLHAENVRWRLLGRREGLSPAILAESDANFELMRHNTGLALCLAINYGGRAEIVDAVRRLVAEGVPAEQIDEPAIGARLYAADLPEPDLIVRTSGEMRVSNFLLWQVAYAEFVVTPKLWPEFDRSAFLNAILEFQGRERRFGKTSAQIRAGAGGT